MKHALTGPRTRREEGAALLTAIVILLALTIMAFALVLVTKVDLSVSRNLRLAEEAMYAAETGALMAAYEADAKGREMTLYPQDGSTLSLDMASDVELSDRYPNWSAFLVKEGLAPRKYTSGRGQSSDTTINYFQYRIQSTGNSRSRVSRTIEMLVRVKQVVQSGSEGYRRIAHRY